MIEIFCNDRHPRPGNEKATLARGSLILDDRKPMKHIRSQQIDKTGLFGNRRFLPPLLLHWHVPSRQNGM